MSICYASSLCTSIQWLTFVLHTLLASTASPPRPRVTSRFSSVSRSSSTGVSEALAAQSSDHSTDSLMMIFLVKPARRDQRPPCSAVSTPVLFTHTFHPHNSPPLSRTASLVSPSATAYPTHLAPPGERLRNQPRSTMTHLAVADHLLVL